MSLPFYTNSNTSIGINNTSIGSRTGTSIYWSPKAKYIVFDKEVEIEGYLDTNTSIIISLINTLGKSYYDDIKKQGFIFDSKLENVIIEHFRIEERDKKINSILDE